MSENRFLRILLIIAMVTIVLLALVIFALIKSNQSNKNPSDQPTATVSPISQDENSRKSKDVDTVTEIMCAAEKVASEVQYDKFIKNGTTFTISASGATLTLTVDGLDNTATEGGRVAEAWKEMASFTSNVQLSSKAFKTNATGTSTVVGTVGKDGNIKWTGAGLFEKDKTDKEGEFFTSYSPDFEKKLAS